MENVLDILRTACVSRLQHQPPTRKCELISLHMNIVYICICICIVLLRTTCQYKDIPLTITPLLVCAVSAAVLIFLFIYNIIHIRVCIHTTMRVIVCCIACARCVGVAYVGAVARVNRVENWWAQHRYCIFCSPIRKTPCVILTDIMSDSCQYSVCMISLHSACTFVHSAIQTSRCAPGKFRQQQCTSNDDT